jgi:hypothetical protein
MAERHRERIISHHDDAYYIDRQEERSNIIEQHSLVRQAYVRRSDRNPWLWECTYGTVDSRRTVLQHSLIERELVTNPTSIRSPDSGLR